MENRRCKVRVVQLNSISSKQSKAQDVSVMARFKCMACILFYCLLLIPKYTVWCDDFDKPFV